MKRIALVSDIKGWAFDLAANIIKNSLKDEFKIDIFYSKSDEFKNDLFIALESLKDYDMIHFFWRDILLDFEKEEFRNNVKSKYEDVDKYIENIVKKISTGVYDHLHEDNIDYIEKFTKYCNSYVVSSEKLFNIYNKIDKIKKPACIMGDSFEKKMFFPKNLERFNNIDKLVIGWAGNSSWNATLKDKNGNLCDFKGFHSILKPVIEELKNEKYNIDFVFADKNINPIQNDKMCDYYSTIHIYICVSNKEGTPKPILEAMGCGVPIITTDVGIVKEAFGINQKNFIIGERVVLKNDEYIRCKLKNKIIELYNDNEKLKQLSEENYLNSSKYEISNMKKIYKNYFEQFFINK